MNRILNFFANRFSATTEVFVVSYPRSGHHAFIGFLNKVSDFAQNYCEFYSCTRQNGDIIPCKYAHVPANLKRFGCGAGNTFLKNHDFDLALPYKKHLKYIVQYRHPFLSIKSWYEMERSKGKRVPSWEEFFNHKLAFWIKFMEKWVIKYGECENVRLVPYESLGDQQFVTELAVFAGAELQANLENVTYKFEAKRTIEYEDYLFETEKRLLNILEISKIAPLFEHD